MKPKTRNSGIISDSQLKNPSLKIPSSLYPSLKSRSLKKPSEDRDIMRKERYLPPIKEIKLAKNDIQLKSSMASKSPKKRILFKKIKSYSQTSTATKINKNVVADGSSLKMLSSESSRCQSGNLLIRMINNKSKDAPPTPPCTIEWYICHKYIID